MLATAANSRVSVFTHADCIVPSSVALLFKADYSRPDGRPVPTPSLSVLRLLPQRMIHICMSGSQRDANWVMAVFEDNRQYKRCDVCIVIISVEVVFDLCHPQDSFIILYSMSHFNSIFLYFIYI